MKKLIALLLALVMVFSVAAVFAGCEDDSKKSSKSEEKDDEDEEKEDEEKKDEDKGDETTNPEGDEQPTEPDGKDDPTDPEPTDPEPTDPEPTEDVQDEGLIGEWVYELDITDTMNEQYSAMLGKEVAIDHELTMVIGLEFENNGEYTMTMHYGGDVEDFFEDLLPFMVEYMYSMMESSGMDKAAADEYFEDIYGMNVEDYCAENLDPDNTREESNGYYLVDEAEGVIYQAEDEDELEDSEDYFIYELDGDVLTILNLCSDGEMITETEGMEGNPAAQMPWIMERQ